MRKVTNKSIRRRIFRKIWCDRDTLTKITTGKLTMDITLDNEVYQISANGSEFYIYKYRKLKGVK